MVKKGFLDAMVCASRRFFSENTLPNSIRFQSNARDLNFLLQRGCSHFFFCPSPLYQINEPQI